MEILDLTSRVHLPSFVNMGCIILLKQHLSFYKIPHAYIDTTYIHVFYNMMYSTLINMLFFVSMKFTSWNLY
jgi:hypothetical protein